MKTLKDVQIKKLNGMFQHAMDKESEIQELSVERNKLGENLGKQILGLAREIGDALLYAQHADAIQSAYQERIKAETKRKPARCRTWCQYTSDIKKAGELLPKEWNDEKKYPTISSLRKAVNEARKINKAKEVAKVVKETEATRFNKDVNPDLKTVFIELANGSAFLPTDKFDRFLGQVMGLFAEWNNEMKAAKPVVTRLEKKAKTRKPRKVEKKVEENKIEEQAAAVA